MLSRISNLSPKWDGHGFGVFLLLRPQRDQGVYARSAAGRQQGGHDSDSAQEQRCADEGERVSGAHAEELGRRPVVRLDRRHGLRHAADRDLLLADCCSRESGYMATPRPGEGS